MAVIKVFVKLFVTFALISPSNKKGFVRVACPIPIAEKQQVAIVRAFVYLPWVCVETQA